MSKKSVMRKLGPMRREGKGLRVSKNSVIRKLGPVGGEGKGEWRKLYKL